MDLSKTQTSVPLVANGTKSVPLRLVDLKKDTTDKGEVLKWSWELLIPVPQEGGGEIQPKGFGSKIFETIQLYAKPDAKDPQWFLKNIATRVDALLGTADEGNKKDKPVRPSNPEPQELIGRVALADFTLSTYNGNTRNELKFTYPKDIPGGEQYL